ncbi:MAG: flagellar FliJ family protein [Proteobacteria bacterium]|nr:flagellar FliJ family protein [Pseudomonadota bacterium]
MPKLRIERIIEIKEKMLDDKKKEMEAVIAGINKITNDINDTDSDIELNYNKITGTLMNGNDIYVIKEYVIFLENKKLEMINNREKLRAEENALRTELLEMIKEIKMLETLKSKELKIIKKSENRKEQKMLDELASRDERK